MFTLRSILTLWNAVFFSSVDPTPIALFRVAIGGLILVNTGLLWPRRELYFGTNGMLDLTTWRERAASHVFSLCKWIPPSVVLGVHGIAGGFVAVGWGTSISLFIAWITMISIHNRNPAILNSGDALMRLLLPLMILSPCGWKWSIDSLWINFPTTAPIWTTRLCQVTVCTLYLRNLYWKSQGSEWRNGKAVAMVFSGNYFIKRPLPNALSRDWVYRLLTYGTFATLAIMGIGVWIPHFKYSALICGITFHIGLAYFMRLQLFPWIMISTYLLFL